jgi:hypothetical protein
MAPRPEAPRPQTAQPATAPRPAEAAGEKSQWPSTEALVLGGGALIGAALLTLTGSWGALLRDAPAPSAPPVEAFRQAPQAAASPAARPQSLLERAAAAARQVESPAVASVARSRVARGAARLDEVRLARSLLEEAVVLVRSCAEACEPGQREEALGEAAAGFAALGDTGQMRTLLDEAFAGESTPVSPEAHLAALASTVLALAEEDLSEEAELRWTRGLRLLEQLPERERWPLLLLHTQRLIEQGHLGPARRALPLLERAAAAKRRAPQSAAAIALLLAQLDQPQAARGVLTRLGAQERTLEGVPRVWLARAQLALGDRTAAERHLAKAGGASVPGDGQTRMEAALVWADLG